jgi:hypothetical protein
MRMANNGDVITVCADCGRTIAVTPARPGEPQKVRHVDVPGEPASCPK